MVLAALAVESQQLNARTVSGPTLECTRDITMLGGIAELTLSLWLMAMGVNVTKREEKAGVQQISGE